MVRYRLLDTTRAYVLNIAIDDTEAVDLAVRHAKYYRRWLEQSGGQWPMLSSGPEQSPHFAALNNTRTALEWCFGAHGDVAIGIELAAAAAPVFLTMSLLPESYRWSQRAIAALDDTTRGGAEEMQLQAGLGSASLHMYGPSAAARAALNRSLALAETRGNVLHQVGILGTLVMFSTRHGEFKIALDQAKRARAIARTGGEPDATALAQSALGRTLNWVGDLSGARSELGAVFQHRSTTQRTSLGLDDRILVGLGLARTLWAQGLPAQAAWELRTAIELARLCAKRGKPEDGRKLLQPIFEQFTEGRDTADLQTAARLLAELGQDQ